MSPLFARSRRSPSQRKFAAGCFGASLPDSHFRPILLKYSRRGRTTLLAAKAASQIDPESTIGPRVRVRRPLKIGPKPTGRSFSTESARRASQLAEKSVIRTSAQLCYLPAASRRCRSCRRPEWLFASITLDGRCACYCCLSIPQTYVGMLDCKPRHAASARPAAGCAAFTAMSPGRADRAARAPVTVATSTTDDDDAAGEER